MTFTKSIFFQLVILLPALLLVQACGDDGATGPDFSTVPDPYDLSQADTTFTKEGGIEIYVIEKGNELFEVIPRDVIQVKMTGRTIDNQIFESSYANGNEDPRTIPNLRPIATNRRPPVEGFRRGLLGMSEGEKRVIIVPPSLGYDDSRPGTNGFDLRGDSLRYDVELVSIQ